MTDVANDLPARAGVRRSGAKIAELERPWDRWDGRNSPRSRPTALRPGMRSPISPGEPCHRPQGAGRGKSRPERRFRGSSAVLILTSDRKGLLMTDILDVGDARLHYE